MHRSQARFARSRSGGIKMPFNITKQTANNLLKTLDKFVETHLSHEILGFTARVAVAGGVGLLLMAGGYAGLCKFEERKPIAQRWCPKWTPVTLIEKVEMEPGSDTIIYRFALPNQYDTLGYTPISSVLIRADVQEHGWKRKKRWYTPISHPDQRGVIEIAVKMKDPGYFCSLLRSLKRGQRLEIGPWIKEFQHKPNTYPIIDGVVAGSGVTPMLQLANVIAANPNDQTKLRILACNLTPEATPFFKRLTDLELKDPRFEIKFCADNGRWDKHSSGAWAATKGWTGSINKDFLVRWLGGPSYTVKTNTAPPKPATEEDLLKKPVLEAQAPSDEREYFRKVLVCGPGPFMTYVAGRSTMFPFLNWYLQGPYTGMLKDLGFKNYQVYRFPNPWTLTTQS